MTNPNQDFSSPQAGQPAEGGREEIERSLQSSTGQFGEDQSQGQQDDDTELDDEEIETDEDFDDEDEVSDDQQSAGSTAFRDDLGRTQTTGQYDRDTDSGAQRLQEGEGQSSPAPTGQDNTREDVPGVHETPRTDDPRTVMDRGQQG